ncbi:hypothetical protein FACS1894211_12550 [Clostridia bacterium]|nr:hypothetical protein FACS1894211_12550 [Clostridia bacterium]
MCLFKKKKKKVSDVTDRIISEAKEAFKKRVQLAEDLAKNSDTNITIAEVMEKLQNSDGRDAIISFVWIKPNWDSAKSEKENLAQFSRIVQNVVIIESYMDEVNNGGHEQFYFNSSGEFADLLEQAIQEVGLTVIKKISAKANRVFFGARTRNEDRQAEGFFSDAECDILEECDNEFYKLSDPYKTLEEYVEKNKNNRFYK